MTGIDGRSFLITGASGYLGSAVARALGEHRCNLRLMSRAEPARRLHCVATATTFVSDGRQTDDWIKAIDGIETVLHFSAQTNLRFAEADPVADAEANVRPMAALLAAAAHAKHPLRIIFASTATVVGLPERMHIDASLPDRPVSVYDRHKQEAEQLLRAAVSPRLRGCSLRLANVYGHGVQSGNGERSVLNAMMRRALAGQPLTLFGDGHYVRDWIHVEDVVAAFLAAARAPDAVLDGAIFLVGTGTGHTLAEAFRLVAAKAEDVTGRAVPVTSVPEPADLHPIERRNAIVDPVGFVSATGWMPQLALRDGIAADLPKYLSERKTTAGLGGAHQ